jgi:hypothetical protein
VAACHRFANHYCFEHKADCDNGGDNEYSHASILPRLRTYASLAVDACSDLIFACQLAIGYALPSDLMHSRDEPVGVISESLIEPERLFIDVAERVERFDRNVGSFDAALEQAPEPYEAANPSS